MPSSGHGKVALADGVPENRKALFADLRELRRRIAQEQNLPAYLIFHDATLVDIAQAMPDTLSQLGRIPGIGQSKLSRYGLELLACVARHRQGPRPDRFKVLGSYPVAVL